MASRIFDRAPNLGILLQYVCNKTLDGRAEEIKEYNIAVEAFGRASDFDKRRDSIVRVEAHRLRKRLLQYYEQEEGAHHAIRVEIPSGQYVPSFIRQISAAPEPAPQTNGNHHSDNPAPAPRPRPRLLWTALAVLTIAAAMAASVYLPRRTGGAPAAISAASVHPVASGADAVRILAGSTVENYTDAFGSRWSGDRYFTGGSAVTVQFRSIGRTREPAIFLKRREGEFRYDIPLSPGPHELRLFFAETVYGEGNVEGGGESSRLFDVTANGRPLLEFFDVTSDAEGANTADVKVFKDIEPASDGFLHLQFIPRKAFAFLNAIEVDPGERGKLRPIRLVAHATGYTDSRGQVWSPDSYFSGGRIVLRQEEVAQTPDPGIYQSERYGNFSYAIPVAPGTYTAVLHFAETWHGPGRPDGGGAGSRLFDIFCNRVMLLRDFDIFTEAKGGYRALKKTFTGLRPNAQGKLHFTFAPTRNYACINAIEVLDEGNSR